MNGYGQRQAIIYCRVSDQKQVRVGDGLNSQETRCREFARGRGYTVAEVFKDDFTGALADRPAMQAMLALLRSRRVDAPVVVIDDISRLARDLGAHWELRLAIKKAGGTLESPSVKFGEDADSIFIENVLASSAQHQRQKNAEQTKNRMRARVMNGYWVFQAPHGYKYERVTGRGQMLTRHEPVASIVQEALEGYASGRFERQADVMRFLQDNPLFPKDGTGIIRNERVSQLLKQPAYAGYIEVPGWNVSLRQVQHEPLVSFETFQRVQHRLNGGFAAPRRKNLDEDFALRGFVLCDDCDTPLTACWSKGNTKHHPYYLCQKRGCASRGKSIRRDVIEGEFEALLQTVQPSEKLFRVARAMFEELWNRRLAQGQAQAKALADDLKAKERQVEQLLERILDVSTPSVIAAYEERIRKLEADKLLIKEKMASAGRPASTFADTLRTALDFLANPWNLWNSGRLEDRRTVLRLTFANRLRYHRGTGLRTPDLSLPFKALAQICGGNLKMARPKRFELLTPRFVVWCSIQLSYGRI